MADPVTFKDLAERETKTRDRLKELQQQLEQKEAKSLTDKDVDFTAGDKKLLAAVRKELRKPVVDPLYVAVQKDLKANNQKVDAHDDGKLPSQKLNPGVAGFSDEEQVLLGLYGILERDNLVTHLDRAYQSHFDPHTFGNGAKPEFEPGERFVKAVAAARGEYNSHRALFDKVLPILVKEGAEKGDDYAHAEHLAVVVRRLVEQDVEAKDIHIGLKTKAALANLVGASDGAPPSSFDIDLPDLEAQSDVEIVVDNLHASQALYFAWMLEEVKLFQVVEKLVELFNSGMLPLGKGNAGDLLYAYWRKSADRFSEVERRNIYARVFGAPGGDAEQAGNREFSDLWLRFISGVSSFVRQREVDNLFRSKVPFNFSAEQVKKGGRDLAANLSLHSYGIAFFAAVELEKQIKETIKLLSEPEVKSAYGARDMWQVIEQVSALELGGARNSVRYRTLATSGATIIRWLADHVSVITGTSRRILDPAEINSPLGGERRPTVKPTDGDLVDACESWLAVTGTSEERVEEYAQPVEGPNVTSRPIQIPSAARDLMESSADLLSSVGVQAGAMAARHSRANGRV